MGLTLGAVTHSKGRAQTRASDRKAARGRRRDTSATGNSLPIYFGLCEPPMVDGLAIEAPVTADLESRDALLLEQTVDRRRMDPEIIRELSHG